MEIDDDEIGEYLPEEEEWDEGLEEGEYDDAFEEEGYEDDYDEA